MDNFQEAGSDNFNLFLMQHAPQLKSSNIPKLFWESLYLKLSKEIFDAGSTFLIAEIPEESERVVIVSKENGILVDDPNEIYLIDHAWTFSAHNVEHQLKTMPQLLMRMANLMGIKDQPDGLIVHDVMKSLWKYSQTYAYQIGLNTREPPQPVWYILDEFGSTIRHSSNPNFRAVPFFYIPQGIAYTLLFPIESVENHCEVTRDYIEGVGNNDEVTRSALLVPWTEKTFDESYIKYSIPDVSYFESGAELETILENPIPVPNEAPPVHAVYSEYPFVTQYLQRPGFSHTDNKKDADVLWLTQHFKDFKSLAETRPSTFINQFPCERVVTTKDLLSIIARRSPTHEKWFPLTYNLVTEVAAFVAVFQKREHENEDNHWIVKPWNLARALDTTVTNNIWHILRLPFSGPKIVQKYIERPVLYRRPDVGLVKFDIRYVILLQSLSPLKLFCYKEFFLRFANEPFELSELWNYEKHFTVMNYRDDSQLHEVRRKEFEEEWMIQFPSYPWSSIQNDVFDAFREIFLAASSLPPPQGMPHWPQSRAVYAADLMLSWENDKIQPKILEINYAPDCERACKYYPDFYNNIFGLLFKGEVLEDKFYAL